MKTEEIQFGARVPIDSYGTGGFRVAGVARMGPLALFADGPVEWRGWPDADVFLARAAEIDVLLLGMGADAMPVPPEIGESLRSAGIGFEAMATPSACRTYNVLLSEGRRVAAALIPL